MNIGKFFNIRRIFLLGLLIRILLMPFFAHDDIFAVHKRVARVVCEGVSVFNYSSFGVHTVESVFSQFAKPFVPCSNLSELQKSNENVSNLNRMLFLFKLPYLLFEIGYWYLMWRLIKRESVSMKKKAAIFLSLNPVIIYSVYMFGRFEPYNLFISVLILLALSKFEDWKQSNKFLLIVFSLFAFVLTIRFSYVMLLPALAMAFGGLTAPGIFSAAVFVVVYGFLKLIPLAFARQNAILPESSWISEGAHPNYLFHAGFDTGQETFLYLSIILLAVIFVWWLDKQKRLEKLKTIYSFSLFSTLILLVYYSTSLFHPQYFSWVLPFMLILMLADDKGFIWKMFWFSMPFYFLSALHWENSTTLGLLSPVSSVFKFLDINHFLPLYSAQKWASIGKSVFSGIYFYLIYYLLSKHGKKNITI